MSWLPRWAQKIGALCHRKEAVPASPLAVNRLLVDRAAKRRMEAIVAESERLMLETRRWALTGNVEHLEAIEERQLALNAEAKELLAEVRRIEGMLRASKVYHDRLACHWAEARARYRAAKAEVSR